MCLNYCSYFSFLAISYDSRCHFYFNDFYLRISDFFLRSCCSKCLCNSLPYSNLNFKCHTFLVWFLPFVGRYSSSNFIDYSSFYLPSAISVFQETISISFLRSSPHTIEKNGLLGHTYESFSFTNLCNAGCPANGLAPHLSTFRVWAVLPVSFFLLLYPHSVLFNIDMRYMRVLD